MGLICSLKVMWEMGDGRRSCMRRMDDVSRIEDR